MLVERNVCTMHWKRDRGEVWTHTEDQITADISTTTIWTPEGGLEIGLHVGDDLLTPTDALALAEHLTRLAGTQPPTKEK